MSSLKQLKLEQKAAAKHQQPIAELKTLVKDVERCERTITDLKHELAAVNEKHAGRRTTREDVDYLTDLLSCAKKKLTWEKHLGSLQKRAPELLQRMSAAVTDTQNPVAEQTRAEMLQAVRSLQGAMERLQGTKVE